MEDTLALRGAIDRLVEIRTAINHLAYRAPYPASSALVPTTPALERTSVEQSVVVAIDPSAFRLGTIDEHGRMRWKLAVDGRLVLDIHLERYRPTWDLVGPESSWDTTTGFGDLYDEVEGVGDEARWSQLSDTLHVRADPWQLSVVLEPTLGEPVRDTDLHIACEAARAVLTARPDSGLPVDRDRELCAALPKSKRRWFGLSSRR